SVILIVLILAGWQAYAYVASAPMRAEKVYEQGMTNMTPGRYPEAVRLFTKATDIYPQLGTAYLERGNAENILGQTDVALQDYSKAIEMGSLATAYTARRPIYLSRGDARRGGRRRTSRNPSAWNPRVTRIFSSGRSARMRAIMSMRF